MILFICLLCLLTGIEASAAILPEDPSEPDHLEATRFSLMPPTLVKAK